MIRLMMCAAGLLGFLLCSIPKVRSQKKLKETDPERQKKETFMTIKKAAGMVFGLTGSELTVIGLNNIPEDCPVLFVGNHRSYFDIIVAYMSVKGPTGFVAKKEIGRFQILKAWMELLQCVFLDRSDIKQGLKAILQAIENVKNGISMWIFPEGTRNTSRDISELLPFHEGSMKIAQKTGCPVIPVAITGTRDVFEDHLPWVRPAKITIEFGKPVILSELQPEEKKHSGAYIRGVISQMLINEQTRRIQSWTCKNAENN